jgi:BTB/POZ domain-containing protein KCTD9
MDIIEKKNFREANLIGADLNGVDLHKANLQETDLRKAKNLSIDQLSKVKTLRNAKLDDELLIPLQEKHFPLFE